MRQAIAPSVQAATTPWWLEEAGLQETPSAPQLKGQAEVDVVIVGGGYTGLWTALALREQDSDLTLAVLERGRCGEGPSGRNGGFLHGYWSSIGWLRQILPDDRALELARAGDRIIPAVDAFVRRRSGDAWLRRGGLLKVATTPAQVASIEAAVTAAESVGAREEALPLEGDELAERCASPRFRRGVLFRDGATVQPARLVKLLRDAVLDDPGTALHEQTPVRRLQRGTPNVVTTPKGALRAHSVVLAVGAAAAGWRPTASRLTNFGSYVVLSEPAPELIDELGWTGGEAITDARMFLHYFRTTPDGRVLMGSGSGPIGLGGRLDARFTDDSASVARAEAGLKRLLPAFSGVRLTHAWGGPIDVSSDRLPFVGSVPGSRIHYAAGFSGNGVGPSWLAGQALGSLVTARKDEWTTLPLVERRWRRLPPEPLKRLGGGLVRAAALAVEEADDAGRRAAPGARAVSSLPRLLGVRVGLR